MRFWGFHASGPDTRLKAAVIRCRPRAIVCDIGVPPDPLEVWSALDTADTIVPAAGRARRIAERGRRIVPLPH